MTQSQLKFAGATSILAWAGKDSIPVLRYVDMAKGFTMPFIFKDGLYYYFAERPDCYELVMTSSRDLNGE